MIQQISELFSQARYAELFDGFFDNWTTLDHSSKYFLAVAGLMESKYSDIEPIFKTLKKHADNLPDFYTYYALLMLKLGDPRKAKTLIQQEKSRSILYFEINLEVSLKCGNVRRAKRLLAEAKDHQLSSLNLDINEGVLLYNQNKVAEARVVFLNLVQKHPFNKLIINYLVNTSILKIVPNALILVLENYLKKDPSHLPYIWRLVTIYSSISNLKGMAQALKLLKKTNDEYSYIRECFAIPALFESADQIQAQRDQMEHSFLTAIKQGEWPFRADQQYGCTPFFLSYHTQNNKNLMNLCYQILSKKLIQVPKLKPLPKRKKIRLAIISTYFHDHSVMNFYGNLILNLPNHFHVTLIHVNPFVIDETTRKLYARANKVIDSNGNHDDLVPMILKAQYDMIFYPEIGMSPKVYYLAMLRLAPIQFTVIGHPETSGMPTIDYYLSWQQFHGKNPQQYFTEKLVQLKNFPIAFPYPKKMKKAAKTRKQLGLPLAPKKLFFVPMLLFKAQPAFDEVVIRIIQDNPQHHVVFIEYSGLEKVVLKRLGRVLTKAQLQQIIFRPPYHREDYFSVLKQVDVNLETFPFGGGNTVLQSIASGTPIITLTGDQIKGRFGTGFYAQLGTSQFCATTIDEYVTKAIDVAHNPKIKADFSSFVKENKGRLFDNFSGTHEAYEWLLQVHNDRVGAVAPNN